MRITFSLALISLLLTAGVRAQQDAGALASDRQRLIEGILRWDSADIGAAAATGDARFIPYLKTALDGVKPDGNLKTWEESGTSPIIEFALVKLDDTETEQAYWCWLIRETAIPEVGWLKSVGGWFSIQALDAVLDGAGRAAFIRAVKQWPPTDVSCQAPESIAVETLPKIVSGPAVGSRSYARWHEWIEEHRDELKSLKPTGAGVNFSEAACQDGRPR